MMARYDYKCRSCEVYIEIERSINDPETDIACPDCATTLVRVYGPINVALKGDGFYKTDSKPQSTNFYKENGSTL